MDKFFKNTQGTLHSHSAIAPFGSPNTVYAVRSLHFALPYFAPFHSAKHRIRRNVRRKNEKGFIMKEYNIVYRGPQFENIDINPVTYCDEYFQTELDLESDLFYELRKKNDIKPYRINESKPEELLEIKAFFNQNKDTFYFLFNKLELIGSILYLKNYIQSLAINRKFQNKGYGSILTKFVVNKILSSGYDSVTLKVMDGNLPALELYKKLGFEIEA